jgi:hypothetical protein
MPSITLTMLKGLYTLYCTSSSIPEFGFPWRTKTFRLPLQVEENGAIEVVGNLAPTIFLPLATKGLYFKNYQL